MEDVEVAGCCRSIAWQKQEVVLARDHRNKKTQFKKGKKKS